MKAIDLRPGYGVKMEGKFFVVVGYEFRNPGNLRSFVNIKYKNVQSGQVIEKRHQPSEDVEQIDLDRRPMEFLYKEGTDGVFMDTSDYDQINVPQSVLGDALLYLRPNATATVVTYEGRAILIELPPAVELTVKDCAPGVKKATVTNVQKDAEMETGLKTRVPDFIEMGESVRISTTDGSYMSRA
ncbi:MAG: elongation factor P [Planctomyces sp.]|nr:elongation factor P [Planctomyces sp.]MBA4039530.1 elongation factor P [Planctomyces sp.]MBA4119995.1 elongation factor P [Isosphaera sp.]